MRALLCKALGKPESLILEDVEPPTPAPDEVLIDVHRAGLNFADLLMIAGQYQVKPPLPFAPGMEVAGSVADVGSEVRDLSPGDRVMAIPGHGGLAEQVAVNHTSVHRLPEAVSFEQGAGFPITYGTTYYALRDRGRLQPGEVLLVHGASGGVGLNAVELGHQMGATVIGTVGADEKMEIVRSYGADHVFNYRDQRIRDAVRELTGGVGADVVYDPVGGDAFDESLRCINWDGRLLVIGFASGRIPQPRMNLVLLKNCQIVGVFWGAWSARFPGESRRQFETLLEWTAQGELRPPISRTLPLESAIEGLEALAARKATGKIIVELR